MNIISSKSDAPDTHYPDAKSAQDGPVMGPP